MIVHTGVYNDIYDGVILYPMAPPHQAALCGPAHSPPRIMLQQAQSTVFLILLAYVFSAVWWCQHNLVSGIVITLPFSFEASIACWFTCLLQITCHIFVISRGCIGVDARNSISV